MCVHFFGTPCICIILGEFILYRVIQEESAILWEMIVCVILSKKVHMNMGPILNSYRDYGKIMVIHPSYCDACDVSCDVIYYVIAVCARRMVCIFFLP